MTETGAHGVIGQNVPSHVVEGYKAGGDIVTVLPQRGGGIIVRGWELKSYHVTLTTVQVH